MYVCNMKKAKLHMYITKKSIKMEKKDFPVSTLCVFFFFVNRVRDCRSALAATAAKRGGWSDSGTPESPTRSDLSRRGTPKILKSVLDVIKVCGYNWKMEILAKKVESKLACKIILGAC